MQEEPGRRRLSTIFNAAAEATQAATVNAEKAVVSVRRKAAPTVHYKDSQRLHIAVVHGNSTEVRHALRASVDAGFSECSGLTPLHKAAYRGDVDACRVLIGQAASVCAKDHAGQTPLHAAVLQVHAGAVQLLLRQRAVADDADKEGITPARAATARCHRCTEDAPKLAMCLDHLTRAYDQEMDCLRASDPSAPSSSVGDVQALEEPCFFRHSDLGDGSRPLSSSTQRSANRSLAQSRPGSGSASGEKPHSSDEGRPPGDLNSTGSTAFGSAVSSAANGSSSSFFLEVGSGAATREATLQRGASPSPKLSSRLSSRGRSIVIKDSCGTPAFRAPSQASTPAEVSTIMEPLLKATLHGDMDQVRALFRCRATADMSDSSGHTALHIAATAAQPAVLRYLLNIRADPSTLNREGLTPLRCAVERLHNTKEGGEVRRLAPVLDALLLAQEKEIKRWRCQNSIKAVELSQKDVTPSSDVKGPRQSAPSAKAAHPPRTRPETSSANVHGGNSLQGHPDVGQNGPRTEDLQTGSELSAVDVQPPTAVKEDERPRTSHAPIRSHRPPLPTKDADGKIAERPGRSPEPEWTRTQRDASPEQASVAVQNYQSST